MIAKSVSAVEVDVRLDTEMWLQEAKSHVDSNLINYPGMDFADRYSDPGDARGLLAASEILLDLLLATVQPARMDFVYQAVEEDAAQGDSTSIGELRLLNAWTAQKAFGNGQSLADQCAESEVDALVMAAQDLLPVLALVGDNDRIAAIKVALKNREVEGNAAAALVGDILDSVVATAAGTADRIIQDS